MSGVPASEINAQAWPVAARRVSNCSLMWVSLWSCKAVSGVLMPKWSSRRRLWRVSSHKITSTAASVAAARDDKSPRLPIGVATM